MSIVAPGEGTPFGRYRLLGELGHGGMGIVYRAVNEGPQGFSRVCVIKRIIPHLARDPEFIQSLVAEARLSALLIHPSIVQVYELGEINGESYLAMEYVDGVTLIDVLHRLARAQGKFPLGLVCFMIAELAAALAYAHALTDGAGRPLEIVHRDISPSNVMLCRTGTVKLLDFGIAKAASHLREEQTRTGTLKGKFAYMSPEQAEGLPIDHRSDLFSLGIVFWEVLTLRRLFRTQDDMQTLRLVREAKVEPTGIDLEIDALVLKMLARHREDRFSTGEEIAAALHSIAMRLHGNAFAMRKFLAQLPEREELPTAPNQVPGPQQTEQPTRSDISLRTQETSSLSPTSSFQNEPHTTGSHASGEIVNPPGPTPTASAIQLKPRRRGLVIGGVVAGAAATALVVMALTPGKAGRVVPPPAAQPVAAAPIAEELPVAPVPAEVHLELNGTPHATVVVDSKPVGSVPFRIALPRRSAPRSVEVRRPGFVTSVQKIDGESDAILNVNLVRRAMAKNAEATRAPKGDIKDPFAR